MLTVAFRARSTVLWRATALAITVASAHTDAWAQRCPAVPPDFRPHVAVYPRNTMVSRGTVSLAVYWRAVHCTTSRAPEPRVRPVDVRVTVTDGPFAGRVLTVRVARGDREALEVVLPSPGLHTLRIERVGGPALEAATVRVYSSDPARARRVSLRLQRSALDRDARETDASIELVHRNGTSAHWFGPDARRGRTLRLEGIDPGTYTVRSSGAGAVERRATVTVSEGPTRAPVTVTTEFSGGSAELRVDWIPSNGRMYEVVTVESDGTRTSHALGFDGTSLGEDLAVGALDVRLRSTPRRNPWNPSDPTHVWTEHHHETLTVEPARALALRWSLASLFANATIAPRRWTELPGLSSQRVTPRGDLAPSSSLMATAGDSLVVLSQSASGQRVTVSQRGARGWDAIECASEMARGSVADGALAAVSRELFAWVDGTDSVSFRTRTGVSQERVALFDGVRPSPCFATGIAALSDQRLVVVGRCRANAPEHDASAPLEGWLAVRSDTQWIVRPERPQALRTVAAIGDTAYAAGDGGTLLALRGDGTLTTRMDTTVVGARDLRAGRTRLVLLDYQHQLFELSPSNLTVTPVRVESIANRVFSARQHCLVGDSLVAVGSWSSSRNMGRMWPGEGMLLSITAAGLRTLRPEGTRIVAIACATDAVYSLEQREDGSHAIERVEVSQ